MLRIGDKNCLFCEPGYSFPFGPLDLVLVNFLVRVKVKGQETPAIRDLQAGGRRQN